ncbi:MAG: hypothetical protein JWQ95_266 [Sphaerisporangium sp.]|nr:hypothetical protein [Sphaerisporangium sp.]
MTGPAERSGPETRVARRDRQLAVLTQTYPAWRISRMTNTQGRFGGWWATRYAPLTEDQRAAGLVPSIARWDALTLSMELAVQDEAAHRTRYSIGEQPLPGLTR